MALAYFHTKKRKKIIKRKSSTVAFIKNPDPLDVTFSLLYYIKGKLMDRLTALILLVFHSKTKPFSKKKIFNVKRKNHFLTCHKFCVRWKL
jgi:hypothetical protein